MFRLKDQESQDSRWIRPRGGLRMGQIVIARPINGISINGNEYVLDESNEVKTFDNTTEAVNFLKENGCTDEEIEGFSFLEQAEFSLVQWETIDNIKRINAQSNKLRSGESHYWWKDLDEVKLYKNSNDGSLAVANDKNDAVKRFKEKYHYVNLEELTENEIEELSEIDGYEVTLRKT